MLQVSLNSNFAKNIYALRPIVNVVKSNNSNADSVFFTGNNLRVVSGNLSYEMKEKIEDLIDNPPDSNSENFIGEGGVGKVYKFSLEGKAFAVKIAKKNTHYGMWREADILDELPPAIKKIGQNRIAYGKTKEGYDFLVTNFIRGKSNKIPENKEQLKSLIMDNFLELDKVGILHNDLGEGNILIDSERNKVNLIDYSHAEKVNIFNYDEDDRLYDSIEGKNIIIPSNLFLFEVNALGDYLTKLSNDKINHRKFFKNYLEVKSEYHEQRIKFLEVCYKNKSKINQYELIDNEKIIAKMLKNPSDEIIDLEAQRCELLYFFHEASRNSFLKKPISTITSWTKTIVCARKYKEAIKNKLNTCKDGNMKKYLEFRNKYAEFYFRKFYSWGHDTIRWNLSIFSEDTKDLKEKEQIILENGIKAL